MFPKIVAPFTGAWIETRKRIFADASQHDVAPFTGAWIETGVFLVGEGRTDVAPFTGAWIETLSRVKG